MQMLLAPSAHGQRPLCGEMQMLAFQAQGFPYHTPKAVNHAEFRFQYFQLSNGLQLKLHMLHVIAVYCGLLRQRNLI